MEITDNYIEFRKSAQLQLILLYNPSQECMPWIKRCVLSEQPIAFYNKCKMYFDMSSLPPVCTDIYDLSNKAVLYGIYCNDKFYIGSTTDFGERMATHIKDSKKSNSLQLLYSDMIKTGECISFVFSIFDDERTLRDAEHAVIKRCKEYSIEKVCNFDEQAVKFINESVNDSKEYAQKYCYNIVN